MAKDETQASLFSVAVPPRAKTSFSLTSEAKFRLATLKRDLRAEGISATESSIVEALIATAIDDEDVMRKLRLAHSVPRSISRKAG